MQTHNFVKVNNRWFIDNPDLGLPLEGLEIEDGGKEILEKICDNKDKVRITYSTYPFENCHTLVYKKCITTHKGLSAEYRYDLSPSEEPLWFSETIKKVFGCFPLVIYFGKD